MKSRLDDLLEFACGEVGDEDFRLFCPNDPGDMSYVDLCIGVRSRQEVPEEVDPEWFEVFGIAQRGTPEKPSESGRFVRFRLFCGAVAAKFLLAEPGLDTVVIVNYVCCSLVQSARLIGSDSLTEILVDVFPALAKEMEDYRAPSGWVVQEYPFCLLAGMLMAEDLEENGRVAELAGQLLKAEEQVREESLGCAVGEGSPEWSGEVACRVTGEWLSPGRENYNFDMGTLGYGAGVKFLSRQGMTIEFYHNRLVC